jgi:DNA-binding protein Fis
MGSEKITKTSLKLPDDDGLHLDSIMLKDNITDIQETLIKTYLATNFLNQNLPLKLFLNTIEKDIINLALTLTNGSQTSTAFLLGIKSTTLSEKIKKFKIHPIKRKKI